MDYQVQEDYIPIIVYHQIGDETKDYMIKIEDFRDQIEYLTDNSNCNWITIETLSEYVETQQKIPTNACLLNFDDGTSQQYHNVLCTLNTYKIPATYYIETRNVDDIYDYYLKWDEIYKLNDIGHDIEPHSLTHPHLSTLNYEEQKYEILQSKIDLENKNITVKSFSYPYGDFDENTLDILRKSDYVLARDIEQITSWKEKRSPVISFNDDYMLHYYYIETGRLSGEELLDIIKYTGWWQFEDNYKKINDYYGTINEYHDKLPTDTSYSVLALNNLNDEISTQFITKYEGSFTLDVLVYNSTIDISFIIKIDDVTYYPQSHDFGSYDSLKYTIERYDYYNFYINIPSLSAGVHTINIVNTLGENLYLDKFRLFSDVNQDFEVESYYKECDIENDDYCICQDIVHDNPWLSVEKIDIIWWIVLIIFVLLVIIGYLRSICARAPDKNKCKECNDNIV